MKCKLHVINIITIIYINFNIFINSICSVISPGRVLLFEDDAKIVHTVSSIEDVKYFKEFW